MSLSRRLAVQLPSFAQNYYNPPVTRGHALFLPFVLASFAHRPERPQLPALKCQMHILKC